MGPIVQKLLEQERKNLSAEKERLLKQLAQIENRMKVVENALSDLSEVKAS
ncbi:hypothetical protein ACFYKX_10405 [Cytobacillus sp. FJAT-54145]|uniref:Uncharacterized protein n=1 Tax=Cytobacillus spartinae TaxID=3299023 RepID=A0ABW6KDQ3_9BACI